MKVNKDYVYMVKYDDGWEFEYSLFHNLKDAEKERQRIFDTYGFKDLEEWEMEREGDYRINDTYGWAWLDLKKVEVN